MKLECAIQDLEHTGEMRCVYYVAHACVSCRRIVCAHHARRIDASIFCTICVSDLGASKSETWIQRHRRHRMLLSQHSGVADTSLLQETVSCEFSSPEDLAGFFYFGHAEHVCDRCAALTCRAHTVTLNGYELCPDCLRNPFGSAMTVRRPVQRILHEAYLGPRGMIAPAPEAPRTIVEKILCWIS